MPESAHSSTLDVEVVAAAVPDPSAANRGAERWRRILVSTGGAVGARAVAMTCTLLTIPIALRYLGAERYGVWMTLTSAVSMLSFFDFGLGIGLQNRVAALMGQGRLDDVGGYLRSAFVVLAGLSVVLFGLFVGALLLSPIVPWLARHEAYQQVPVFTVLMLIGGAFLLGLPLGLFPRLAFGVQQGWIAGVAASSGTAFTLLAVIVASQFSVGFTVFVALTVIPPIAAQGVALFLLARRVPGLSLVGPISWQMGVSSLRQGSRFVLPQVAAAVLAQSPLVLLGTLSSPVNAAIYSVFSRLSLPFQLLQQLFLDQVWPAITEALHRGDVGWLRQMLRRMTLGNLAFAGAAVVAVGAAVLLLFPLLTRTSGLTPSPWLVALYALHIGVTCLVQAYAYISNGLGRLRRQYLYSAACILFSLTLLPVATRDFGTAGLVAGLLVLNGVFGLPLLYAEYAAFVREETGSRAR